MMQHWGARRSLRYGRPPLGSASRPAIQPQTGVQLMSESTVVANPAPVKPAIVETQNLPEKPIVPPVEKPIPPSSPSERFFSRGERSERDEIANLNDLVSPSVRESLIEEVRQADSMRGLLVETINILYREYGIRGLKYFRLRVEDARTTEELKVAADMLLTIGRFHEVANQGPSERL